MPIMVGQLQQGWQTSCQPQPLRRSDVVFPPKSPRNAQAGSAVSNEQNASWQLLLTVDRRKHLWLCVKIMRKQTNPMIFSSCSFIFPSAVVSGSHFQTPDKFDGSVMVHHWFLLQSLLVHHWFLLQSLSTPCSSG